MGTRVALRGSATQCENAATAHWDPSHGSHRLSQNDPDAALQHD
jgi:hypothetical protein